MVRPVSDQLADLQREYRQLAESISEIGFISSGSVTRRHTRCGTPGCACQTDPERRHGPYWQWTRKVNGKTVTRRLTEREAALYTEWISNDRQLRARITQMRDIAAQAAELIANDPRKV